MSASRGTSRRSGWTEIGRRRAAEPKDNAAVDTSLSDVNMRLCHCTLQSRICQIVVNPIIVNYHRAQFPFGDGRNRRHLLESFQIGNEKRRLVVSSRNASE